MIVKVIIKREVKSGESVEFFQKLKELRFLAMNRPGYISGETLIGAENTNKVLIISVWETLEDWEEWKANTQRQELEVALMKFQETPPEYEPYVFSKYKAAAETGFPPPLQHHDR